MSHRGGSSKSSGYKRGRRGEPKSPHAASSPRTDAPDVDESSPVIQAFRGYQKGLDARHDKYERLVKLSRDITIDSKRTIFLLHRVTGSGKGEELISEAEAKLSETDDSLWRSVAKELKNEDPYQFLRAYSPGLQEYIEAVSFLHYIKHSDLVSLTELESRLTFERKKESKKIDTEEEEKSPASSELDAKAACETKEANADVAMKEPDNSANSSFGDVTEEMDALTTESPAGQDKPNSLSVHIPPVEYLLGIADLTGELMRQAITSVGSGNLDIPTQNCTFMRCIHDAFVSLGNTNRELPRKLYTLKQSLQKVEKACYALQVRGSEIPKHMLADVFNTSSAEPSTFNSELVEA